MIPKNAMKTDMLLMMFVCVVCILQSACTATASSPTPNPNIGDGGFLSGETCGPPCFFGIIPGATTKDDAIQILQSNSLYQDCKEFDNSKQGGIHGITCSTQLVVFQADTDTIMWIGFSSSRTITVGEVVAKYGPPDAVSVSSINPSNQKVGTINMTLYYDSINVQLGLSEQNSDTYNLTPNTVVEGINYFSQNEYQLDRSRYSRKWNDYGVYEVHSP